MATRSQVNFGGIARFAFITSLIAAVVCFFAIPDQRWIAGIIVAIGVLDALILGYVLPNARSGRAGTQSELDRLNAEAEAADLADDEPVSRPDDAPPPSG